MVDAYIDFIIFGEKLRVFIFLVSVEYLSSSLKIPMFSLLQTWFQACMVHLVLSN